jgi:hypothetical protein
MPFHIVPIKHICHIGYIGEKILSSCSNATIHHHCHRIICLPLLDIDAACGFFKDISISPACDMVPKIGIVIPLALVTMP